MVVVCSIFDAPTWKKLNANKSSIASARSGFVLIHCAYYLGGSVLANQIVRNKMNTSLETTSKLPTLSISHGTTLQQSEQLTTDLNRLDRANTLAKDDKILLAAHVLQGIDDVHLQPVHHDILKEAAILKRLLKDNTTNIDESDNSNSDWIKQGNHNGKHNFSIYYKLLNNDPKGQELSCRLDTIIPHTLLVPILSVLNESELYQTWLPCWSVPKLKVVKSEKLRQTGRCSQVVNVETEVPWPLSSRQVILKAVACDNIDSYSEEDDEAISVNKTQCLGKDGGRIIIRLQSLDCDDNIQEGLDIPPIKTGTVRMRVAGGFTIEKCPPTHPSLKDAAKSSEEDLVLITFTFTVDPQLAIIPKQFINFFLRTAIGTMWNMFLNIAEGVKDGKHPEHSKAIKEKRELYDWIRERTRVMLGQSQASS